MRGKVLQKVEGINAKKLKNSPRTSPPCTYAHFCPSPIYVRLFRPDPPHAQLLPSNFEWTRQRHALAVAPDRDKVMHVVRQRQYVKIVRIVGTFFNVVSRSLILSSLKPKLVARLS